MNTFSLFSYFFSPFFAVYLHYSPLAFLFSSHPLNSVRVLGYHTLFLCSLDFITSPPPRGSSFLLLHFRSIRLPRFDVYYSNEIIILFSRRRIFSILIKRRSLSPRYVSAYIFYHSAFISPSHRLYPSLPISLYRADLESSSPRISGHDIPPIRWKLDCYLERLKRPGMTTTASRIFFSHGSPIELYCSRCVKKNDNRGGYLSSSKKRERRDTIDFRARIKYVYIYVFIVEFLKND